MGRHRSSGSSSPNAVVARAVGALVAVILFAGALVAVMRPGSLLPAAADPCHGTTTLRVMTSSSFSPVLADLAPKLASNPDCLRLAVTVVDGRQAFDRLTFAKTDVWIPDDGAWAMRLGADVLTPPGQVGAHVVLATSPIYQVTDKATATRIKAAGGTWDALSGLLAGGSGVRLAVRDPAGSGDGLVAFGALGEAVWLKKGMDSATVASVATRRVSRAVTGGGPALPSRPGEVGLVPEYALAPALKSTAGQLDVLTGADRTSMLRFTWLPLTAAVANPARKAALERLLGALKSKAADRAIGAANLRRPGGGPPPGVPAGRVPQLASRSFDGILPHHIDHIFAAWYPEDRRAKLLVVVDVSGSMASPAPGTNTSLIRLVASGCASVDSLLPDDSQLGLWEFGSQLAPPRDYLTLVPSAPLTPDHRRALSGAIGKLAALSTGTGLYDTILAAYQSAVASYQPGMPNQVLVFTDGVNESDPGGITLKQLTAGISAVADPRRPVSLAVAAFGSKPDGGLKDALKQVESSVVRVGTAPQVAAVFVHAAVGGLRT
jgi:hypothetical protein